MPLGTPGMRTDAVKRLVYCLWECPLLMSVPLAALNLAVPPEVQSLPAAGGGPARLSLGQTAG